MKNKKILFLILALGVAAFGKSYTIDEIIRTSADDRRITLQNEKHKFLNRAFPGMPLIDKIEIRAQEKSFDINNTEYSLKIQPRGIGETFASARYRKALIRKSEQKSQLVIGSSLSDRYKVIIDLLEQESKHKLYQDLMDVYSDKIKVMEKLSTVDPKFDITELINVENNNVKTLASDMECRKLSDLFASKLKTLLNNREFTEIDTTGILTIDSLVLIVEKKLTDNAFTLDSDNVHVNKYKLDLDIAENRYKLEKAETRKYLSYLEFSYDNGEHLDQLQRKTDDKDYNLNDAFTIGLGVTIPFLTTRPHVVVQRKADFIKAKEEYEAFKEELNYLFTEDINDLKYYIIQYRILKARELEVDAEASLKKYLQFKGAEPLVLLSIKENIIKNQLNRADVIYGLYRNYIQVLDMTGELIKWPTKNFLLQQ
jgi:hypothetical protein